MYPTLYTILFPSHTILYLILSFTSSYTFCYPILYKKLNHPISYNFSYNICKHNSAVSRSIQRALILQRGWPWIVELVSWGPLVSNARDIWRGTNRQTHTLTWLLSWRPSVTSQIISLPIYKGLWVWVVTGQEHPSSSEINHPDSIRDPCPNLYGEQHQRSSA